MNGETIVRIGGFLASPDSLKTGVLLALLTAALVGAGLFVNRRAERDEN